MACSNPLTAMPIKSLPWMDCSPPAPLPLPYLCPSHSKAQNIMSFLIGVSGQICVNY